MFVRLRVQIVKTGSYFMLNFANLTLQDIKTIKPYFHFQQSRICDDTAGVVTMWRDYFHTEFAVSGNSLILKLHFGSSITGFQIPLGKDWIAALGQIELYCRKNSLPLIYCNVPDYALPYLRNRYPGAFIQPSRTWSDYLYRTEDLLNFKGKRYDGQRNHIHRFQKLYPDYQFTEITEENLPRIRQFYHFLSAVREKPGKFAQAESTMVEKVLECYAEYGQFGGFVETGGKIAAFSIGERVNDTIYVHIEKADTRYIGAYQVIVQEFLKHFSCTGDIYVNREEDVGDDGLRKSKLSYHPVALLTKSTLIANGSSLTEKIDKNGL
jgi:hypothetical protein